MPDYPIYDGPTSVNVSNQTQTLMTQGKIAPSDLTINPPLHSVENNEAGGQTVTIGGE